MKTQTVVLIFTLRCILGCNHPTENKESGLQGRVYANAGPGFFEYDRQCTVMVSKIGIAFTMEIATDSLGSFRIQLEPGSYVLDVKESPDIYTSGPYTVPSGSFIDAKAYYYNAMVLRYR